MQQRPEKRALFRFYEELNDLLPEQKRKKDNLFLFSGNPPVKDAIEAQNVPHTEVDMILVNGKPVSFSYRLKNDDRVSVYPVFESFDIGSLKKDGPNRENLFKKLSY